jgi:hypothetical protein
MAADLDLALILVHHWNKGQGSASSRISGSHAYRDAVRSVLSLVEDQDTGQRILGVDKSNYSNAREIPTLAFAVQTTEVHLSDGQTSTVGRAECLGETDLTVDEVASRTESNLGDWEKEILELASERDTISAKDVSDLLGYPSNTARQYLRRLKIKGTAESPKAGTFQITEAGRRLVSPESVTALQRDNAPGVVTSLFQCDQHPGHPVADFGCARCAAVRSGDGYITDLDGHRQKITGHWCSVCGWPTPNELITTHPNCAARALAG